MRIPIPGGDVFFREIKSRMKIHLDAHGQVDHAVMNTRISLSNLREEQREWGIPRLYSRIPKGILFERV
jgi:hypothetical protein